MNIELCTCRVTFDFHPTDETISVLFEGYLHSGFDHLIGTAWDNGNVDPAFDPSESKRFFDLGCGQDPCAKVAATGPVAVFRKYFDQTASTK
jgi:hypothetical protein